MRGERSRARSAARLLFVAACGMALLCAMLPIPQRGSIPPVHLPPGPAAHLPADALLVGPPPGAQPLRWHTITIYDNGALGAGWQDWSWAAHQLSVRAPGDASRALSAQFGVWGGLYFHAPAPVDLWDGSVEITLSGAYAGGQRLELLLTDGSDAFGAAVPLAPWLPRGLPARRWVTISVPVHASLPAGAAFSGLVLQDAAGRRWPLLYVGQITLREAGWRDYPTGDAAVSVQIDTGEDRHPISPYIYGLAGGGVDTVRTLRPTLARWGGNPSTTYNWQLGNAWNTARDWYYENVNYGNPGGSVADDFAAENRRLGLATWLTIPTIGWVAKDTSSVAFPGPDGEPTDGGGASCLDPKVPADPWRTSIPVGPDFMQQWVRHLQDDERFGIQFFSMDNEPDQWGVTHYDVHPTCTTYDEIYQEFTTYASAVKAVSPGSMVTGPALCCWQDYWDSMAGAADRVRHGNEPFLPWFLQRVRAYDQLHGRRTLDVLDLHYYPVGVYNDATDAATDAWRLQETRALWDPTYPDYSWIAQPVQLIPRMQALIARYYPGTRFGIGEWNWGAETDPSGGLAVADVLGIFGQQHLFMAAYFQYPPAGSPAALAFQMYRNYDGRGGAFGETSVRAASSDRGRVSAYGSVRRADGHVVVVLINKMPVTRAAVTLSLRGITGGRARVYRYDALDAARIADAGTMRVGDGTSLTLAPYSIAVLDIAPGS